MEQRTFCVIIPAYNEELVIASSLLAIGKVVPAQDVYVVSDGSTDKTTEVALRYTQNVLGLEQNQGKAKAIEALLQSYNLLDRYEYVLFSDADSTFGLNFVHEITHYAQSKPACIVGKVSSQRHGLISAYRTYEYGLTNRIFKQAQSTMGVVTVAPGCASLYRSEVLKELDFSERTLTEDFDLTLQIHLKKLGKVIYAPKAIVLTQDPGTLKDYWRQITRWYTGFWQNLAFHKAYKLRKWVFAEIWLILSDSIFWVLALLLGIFHFKLFLDLLGLSYAVVVVLAIITLALEQAWWAFRYILLFPFFQYINLTSYVYSFGRAMWGRNHQLSWEKPNRYTPQSK